MAKKMPVALIRNKVLELLAECGSFSSLSDIAIIKNWYHEIGHIWLNHFERLHSLNRKRMEKEANIFAKYLLLILQKSLTKGVNNINGEI